jgi:LL-diaminopimelate aminotransferase
MIIERADRIKPIQAYYFAQKLKEIRAMNADGGDQVLNLGIGSPDLLPPAPVVPTLHKAALEEKANQYQSYIGLPELRQAFSGWYKRFFEVELDPHDEVLPLLGSKEGINHISMAFLNPGDEVLVPNPGYPAYSTVSQLAGARVRRYDLHKDGQWLPDLKALASQDLTKVKIMWVNYPHMPTGAKANNAFFKELVDFAKRHQILICHDNPYAFILNDEPLSILSLEGAKDVAIELTSLSKCYHMAGWRVGAVSGKKEYLDAILTFKSNVDSGMYKPVQKAAIAALESPASWFADINVKYKERRQLAFEIMDVLGCSYDRNSAGMFVWGKINSTEDAESVSNQLLQEARVFITPGHIFGSNGHRYLRISLCSPPARTFKKHWTE